MDWKKNIGQNTTRKMKIANGLCNIPHIVIRFSDIAYFKNKFVFVAQNLLSSPSMIFETLTKLKDQLLRLAV